MCGLRTLVVICPVFITLSLTNSVLGTVIKIPAGGSLELEWKLHWGTWVAPFS